MAGKFSGEFNLAVCQLKHEPSKLILPIFCHDVIALGSGNDLAPRVED